MDFSLLNLNAINSTNPQINFEAVKEDKHNEYNQKYYILRCIGSIFFVSCCILTFYFTMVGIGYGITEAQFGHTNNMTTGKCFNMTGNCYFRNCHYNPQDTSGLLGSCFVIGFIYTFVFILIAIVAIVCVFAERGLF